MCARRRPYNEDGCHGDHAETEPEQHDREEADEHLLNDRPYRRVDDALRALVDRGEGGRQAIEGEDQAIDSDHLPGLGTVVQPVDEQEDSQVGYERQGELDRQRVDQIGTAVPVARDGAHELLVEPELHQHTEQQAERHRQVESAKVGGAEPVASTAVVTKVAPRVISCATSMIAVLPSALRSMLIQAPPLDFGFGFWILD